MPIKIFAYGCIIDGDEVQRFALEENLKNSMNSLGLKAEEIFIDCTSNFNERPRWAALKNILKKGEPNSFLIYMYGEAHLADNPKDFYDEWHEIVFATGNDLFFRDVPILSTCYLDDGEVLYAKDTRESKLDETDEILFLMARLYEDKTTKLGRKKKGVSQTFIDFYWSWQKCEISGEEFMKAMKIAKGTLYNMCSEYEKTDHYLYSLEHIQNIMYYPKRGRLPEAELFKDTMNKYITKEISAENALEALELQSHIDFKRIYSAYTEGRKGIKRIDFGDRIKTFFNHTTTAGDGEL